VKTRKSAFVCVLVTIALGLFGVPSVAQAVTQTVISGAPYPVALDEDTAGNIYIGDEVNQQIVVIPAITGTILGVSVTAGVAATLLHDTGSFARGIAVNSQGDVFYAASDSKLKVIAAATKTLFGVSVTAHIPTVLAASWNAGSLEFDASGNLFGISLSSNVLQVLPATTGSLFGSSVTANTRAEVLARAGGWFWDLAIDVQGNILIADGWSGTPGVYELPVASGTNYSQTVTANTLTRLTAFGTDLRAGIDVDSAGNVFSVVYGQCVQVFSPSGQDMFGQNIDPNTLTILANTAVSGVTDQGVLVTRSGDLVTGGTNTYRTVNYLPALPSQAVTFDANSGSGSMSAQVASGQTTLTTNSFSRSGFSFAGWNTAANGLGVAYPELSSYSFNSDLTLYAQWLPILTPVASAGTPDSLAHTGLDFLGEVSMALMLLLAGIALRVCRRAIARQ
jgi:hypothetical protein